MFDFNPVFVNLRFAISENIDSNVYRILQYMTEWPMLVGDRPEIYENDFFRNNDWSDFFANNGTVTLGNFVAYENMGIEKVFAINSYVPNNRLNTVYSFLKWLISSIEFNRQEAIIGYLDLGNSVEVITSKRALPIGFMTPEIQLETPVED